MGTTVALGADRLTIIFSLTSELIDRGPLYPRPAKKIAARHKKKCRPVRGSLFFLRLPRAYALGYLMSRLSALICVKRSEQHCLAGAMRSVFPKPSPASCF